MGKLNSDVGEVSFTRIKEPVHFAIRDTDMDMSNTITFNTIDNNATLVINDKGFWVRGVEVPQGEGEAEQVYKAFCEWLKEVHQNV